jgi:putative oxidoreductase
MSDNSVLALSTESQPSKALNIMLWILQALAAAAFLMAGGTKLAGAEMHVATFEKIGLGQWFRYFTGGLEVICAVLLLLPKTAGIGAALLAATMVGAVATHLFIIGGSPAPAIALLLITLVVAWYRRPASLRGSQS